jgi:hypothetical protein
MVIKITDITGKIYYKIFKDYNKYIEELTRLSKNEKSLS